MVAIRKAVRHLPATAQAILLDHMATYCSAEPTAFLFLTATGTHPFRSNFRRVYDRSLKNAGINKHVTLHGLRHSAASIAIDAGVHLLDVSKRLGHARPSITIDVYST
jgi:integrase